MQRRARGGPRARDARNYPAGRAYAALGECYPAGTAVSSSRAPAVDVASEMRHVGSLWFLFCAGWLHLSFGTTDSTVDTSPQTVRVFVIPHTHDDPGWQQTIDEYVLLRRISSLLRNGDPSTLGMKPTVSTTDVKLTDSLA